MFFLQVTNNSGVDTYMFLGTLVMLLLAMCIVVFVIFHQRRIIRYNTQLKKLEEEKQQILLNASIRFQEEERNRIAADLHDDAGPLLATARLYLNENLVNQEKAQQLQSIYSAKQIIDDAILLIRNISHSLMPPTLKNFGLESATTDLFQKISGSGSLNASARFHDYRTRLKVDQELLVFRIIQEQFSNIIKYAQADKVHVKLSHEKQALLLSIKDNGKGFDPAEKKDGIGLININTRASSNNGHAVIYSAPGEGCELRVMFRLR